ncbi:MAG: phosphoenolpyruvate carboxylase [Chakrabartia sp.]
MKTVADLRARLQDLHQRTSETPLFNPVFQLGHDVSRALESGAIDLDIVDQLVSDLSCEALESRARRVHKLLAPVDVASNQARWQALADQHSDGFEGFTARFSQPFMHSVFTAHPTFLLNAAESDAVAQAASSADGNSGALCAANPKRDTLTLDFEHAEAMAALRRAHKARDAITTKLMDHAAAHWPDRWTQWLPQPYRFATWVGYDMDGRTDISWATSLRYRLAEKAERLAGYRADLAAIDADHPLLAPLRAGEAHSRAMAALFTQDLTDPAALSAVANQFTADDPAKLLSLKPMIAALQAEAQNCADAARTRALLVLAAAMHSDGLGMGWLHFRVNASQLNNAIRRRIDPDATLDLSSRTALSRVRELLESVQPLRSNLAALAMESTTALRQFLVMAQILAHVDADAPIRMLIAECEQPQTVLVALYFAKLFGVDAKVDVSPLFETESAMEHGARFLDALLGEPIYRAYARTRGRVAIQTGFSDAGRFVGQVPAALAIERLHGRLARIMARHHLTDVAALVFNTHGESIGRGAHPASMLDRMRYPMSSWARAQFAQHGIRLELEASFQGGDGYLLFRTDQLALATLTRIAEAETAPLPEAEDPFYTRTDISLDFYRGIRRVQREHLDSKTYPRAVTAFGLGLLNETGSRKSRRQSDLAADRDMSLRQIRAIPHNAILQQLGYPVNILAGAGSAAGEDLEGVAELLAQSDRGQALIRLLRAADRLASIKSVAAYGEVFNSAYWASRPYRGTEEHLSAACLALAEHLTKDDRAGVFRRLASRLRVDGMKLHRLLNQLPGEARNGDREDVRRSLGALHALRIALLQHMFLKAVQIPAFSRSNDISRDDVLEMVFTLRIDDALAQLRRAFPVSGPAMSDFAVTAPSDYPDSDAQAYAGIQSAYIVPIEQAYGLILRISTAIANHFGAHG